MSKRRNQRTFGETKNHLKESADIWRELEAIVQRGSNNRMTGEQKFNLLVLTVSILGVLSFFGIIILGTILR